MHRTLICLAVVCASCGDPPVLEDAGTDAGPALGPAAVLFDPSSAGFFDTPFPSDLRTDDQGRPILTGFPRARGLVGQAIDLIEGDIPGFSPVTSVYFRFTGPLDEAALPNLAETSVDGSSVVLVDVDPSSPDRGRRLPAYVRFQTAPTLFWSSNTLSVRAVPGLHMHVGRRYAAVVLEGLRASDGTPVEHNDAFEALKTGSDPHYSALFTELEELGFARADILNASTFTTSDATLPMDQAHAFIAAQELPTLTDWAVVSTTPRMAVYRAAFETYELMDSARPYDEFGSGRIVFDAAGVPAVVGRRRVQIALTVPGDAAPPEGIPIVLYGHGTGGDHLTHVRDEGAELGRLGFAMLGFEAALHGQRNPGGLVVETLLASNPVAAREVVRQTVIDMFLLYRMLAAGLVEVPASITGAAAIAFDTSHVLYMGHSQGSQEAGVLLGVEPTVEAAFLSEGGAGASISLMDRDATPGTRLVCLLATVIGERCEDMTEDHPAVAQIIQPLLDPADPLSFAHRFLRERPASWVDLHIAMTEGTLDEQTPPRAIEALAASIGLPIVEPVARTSDPYDLIGVPTVAAPVSANLTLPSGGRVVGALLQFEGLDHFAIYYDDDAKNRYLEFFRTWLADGAPTLPAAL